MIYAEKKKSQQLCSEHKFHLKAVKDIRFTNIDNETVSYFVDAFDEFKKEFDSEIKGDWEEPL